MTQWQRLIRFEDEHGTVRFGEPDVQDADEIEALAQNGTLTATGFAGDSPFALTPSGTKHKVTKLLGLLTPNDVPLVKCVGLNYMKHSKHEPLRA